MISKTNTKRLTRIIGWVISILALGFVINAILSNVAPIFSRVAIPSLLGTISVASILFVLVITILPLIWGSILLKFSGHWYKDMRDFYVLRDLYVLYGKANIAKYLPSNVLHFAGRQVLAKELGFSHPDIAITTMLEIALLCLASWIVGAGIRYGLGDSFFGFPANLALMIGGVGTIGLIALLALAYQLPLLRKRINLHITFVHSSALVIIILVSYCAYFIATGLILCYPLTVLTDDISTRLAFSLVASYSISWFVGYVTPTAPSGLGVREASFVFLMQGYLPASEAGIMALIYRLITSLADVLFFLAAITLARKKSSYKADQDLSQKNV